MAVFFFDSSALVKLYRREKGTPWVLTLRRSSANRIHVARICNPEVVAAITRQQKAGKLSARLANYALAAFDRDLTGRFRVVITGPIVITEAVQLIRKHALRGYDGVQLAAAMQIHKHRLNAGLPALTFVSADLALNAAAAV